MHLPIKFTTIILLGSLVTVVLGTGPNNDIQSSKGFFLCGGDKIYTHEYIESVAEIVCNWRIFEDTCREKETCLNNQFYYHARPRSKAYTGSLYVRPNAEFSIYEHQLLNKDIPSSDQIIVVFSLHNSSTCSALGLLHRDGNTDQACKYNSVDIYSYFSSRPAPGRTSDSHAGIHRNRINYKLDEDDIINYDPDIDNIINYDSDIDNLSIFDTPPYHKALPKTTTN